MSADDVNNTAVGTVLNQEVEFHVQNTNEQSDTHSETAQGCYAKYQPF